jgi:hypothetical protein
LKINLTTSEPITSKPYPIPIKVYSLFKKEIERLLDEGIIRRSTSTYAAPAFGIFKPNNTLRIVVDYRKLNKITIKDNFPFPSIKDEIETFKDMKYFSKLDMKNGYYQLKVDDNDIYKTAFITPLGQFEFIRVPFGLCNAPKSFQRAMTSILHGHTNVKVYLDDIIIVSKTVQEHLTDLENVFKRLFENKISINFEKCEFFKNEIKYLGMIINGDGVKTDISRVNEAKIKFIPKTRRQIQKLIGYLN